MCRHQQLSHLPLPAAYQQNVSLALISWAYSDTEPVTCMHELSLDGMQLLWLPSVSSCALPHGDEC